jgi:hypothetical protein
MKGTDAGDKLIEKYKLGIKQEKDRIKAIIKNHENPYPKDIFEWDNQAKLNFRRGRFNRCCYEIVENMRNDLLNEIDEI